MNKEDFIDKLCDELGIDNILASELIDSFIDIVTDNGRITNNVIIEGVGTYTKDIDYSNFSYFHITKEEVIRGLAKELNECESKRQNDKNTENEESFNHDEDNNDSGLSEDIVEALILELFECATQGTKKNQFTKISGVGKFSKNDREDTGNEGYQENSEENTIIKWFRNLFS